MSDEHDTGAVYETKQEATPNPEAFYKRWMLEIALAQKAEKEWRKDAEKAENLYRGRKEGSKQRFNIQFSNIETSVPALFNSSPTPDVRRRYGDVPTMQDDPQTAQRLAVSKTAAQVIERALSFTLDQYDFDETILDAIQDMETTGRGVVRVRYEPTVHEAQEGEPTVYQETCCEHVPWKQFIRGPGQRWEDVPWIAFEHHLTREQLIKLDKRIGSLVPLDESMCDDGDNASDVPETVWKRAKVYEIEDKQTRKRIFIAPSYKLGPIRVEDDDLKLPGFFTVPRPLYAARSGTTLEPIVPFKQIESLVDELEEITRRIQALVRIIRWRGVRDPSIPGFDMLEQAEDGELVPGTESLMHLVQNGGLERAIWLMPIKEAMEVAQALYMQREQIKQTIYEVSGMSDIMRGATDPDETLGAQELKASFGSMRTQRKQNRVQRFCRDILRIKADIIAQKFDRMNLEMMTGMPVPAEVEQLLKGGIQRMYRIDVETDSTVRGDLTKGQKSTGEFLQGTAAYMQAVAPMVQTSIMPMDVAVDLYVPFARSFRLGKQAEDALERLSQAAQQQQQQQGPSPEEQKAEMETKKLQMEIEGKQKLNEMEIQHKQASAEIDLGIKQTQAEADMALAERKLEHDAQAMDMKGQQQMQAAQLQQQVAAAKAQQQAYRNGGGM